MLGSLSSLCLIKLLNPYPGFRVLMSSYVPQSQKPRLVDESVHLLLTPSVRFFFALLDGLRGKLCDPQGFLVGVNDLLGTGDEPEMTPGVRG